MATRTRTRLGIAERRAQLLEVGLELFSTRPYDEVRIDEIAARAGVSRGLLYHYFPTKRDFYLAVTRAAAAEVGELTAADGALPLQEPLRGAWMHSWATRRRTTTGSSPRIRAASQPTRRC